MKISISSVGSVVLVLACGPTVGVDPGPGSSGEAMASSSDGTPPGTAGSLGTSETTAITTAADETGSSDGGSTTSETTGEPICVPQCTFVYGCNDGIDNDGDGLIDTDDPECLSPCHDDEESTYHGLPQDGGDCIRDCYYDDNRGSGDDGCYVRLSCDPLGPGVDWGCPYLEGPICSNQDLRQAECVQSCLPLTPPGCDCYGCCTFSTPSGPEDRWLEDPECTLDDPDSCPPCTQHPACVNPCDDPCEWCFGEPDPPPGCPEITCEYGEPCTGHCDCPEGLACMQGCCRPGTFF